MVRHQRKFNLTIHKVALIFFLLTLSSYVSAALKVGDKLNEATLYGLNTPSITLSTYQGKPLIINFWASWCSPCVSEMQSLNNIANNPSYTVIGISTDDNTSEALQLINQQQLSFHNYIDHQMRLEKMFGATTIPFTVLINKQGTIVKIIKGSQQWDSPQNKANIQKIFKPTK